MHIYGFASERRGELGGAGVLHAHEQYLRHTGPLTSRAKQGIQAGDGERARQRGPVLAAVEAVVAAEQEAEDMRTPRITDPLQASQRVRLQLPTHRRQSMRAR